MKKTLFFCLALIFMPAANASATKSIPVSITIPHRVEINQKTGSQNKTKSLAAKDQSITQNQEISLSGQKFLLTTTTSR